MPDEHMLRSIIHSDKLYRVVRTIALAQPAAGADFAAITVPGGAVWCIETLFGQLVCSAAAANRRPVLRLTDGNLRIGDFSENASVTANSTSTHTFARNIAHTVAGLGGQGNFAPAPDIWLQAGATIAIATAGIDVADQWSQGALLIQEILEQPTGVYEDRESGWDERLVRTSPFLGGAS